jgi:DNA-binding transcriptional regulator GbsR (MarR family)
MKKELSKRVSEKQEKLSKREAEILEALNKKVLVKKLYNKPIIIKRNINFAEVAKEMGVSRNRISSAVKKIKEKRHELPLEKKIILEQEI